MARGRTITLAPDVPLTAQYGVAFGNSPTAHTECDLERNDHGFDSGIYFRLPEWQCAAENLTLHEGL